MKKELIELRKFIAKTIFKLSEIKAIDGTALITKEEQIIEGAEIKTYDANGEQIPVTDGIYELENGDKVEIVDGVVKSITAKIEEEVVPIDEVEVEKPVEVDNSIATMLEQIMSKFIELADKVNAMEVKMSEHSETIVKMAAFVPEEEIKEVVSLAKNNMGKSEEAASRAEKIFKA